MAAAPTFGGRARGAPKVFLYEKIKLIDALAGASVYTIENSVRTNG